MLQDFFVLKRSYDAESTVKARKFFFINLQIANIRYQIEVAKMSSIYKFVNNKFHLSKPRCFGITDQPYFQH